jgi:glycosyltransferase involved in cell wall biosynthesis
MHVLILPMYYPERDSSPHRGYMFHEQAAQVAKTGCKVGLVFTEQRPLKNLSCRSFFKESHFQLTAEEADGFTTLRMHAWNPKLSTVTGGKLWVRMTIHSVKQYIKRYGRPDIIHAHFAIWAGWAAYNIYKEMGIPYVVTEHASSINGGAVPETQIPYLKEVYSHAKKVICVGSMLRGNLLKYTSSPEKVMVIPNFVDTNVFLPAEEKKDKNKAFTFISVGNLSKRKGFADLINAFEQSLKDKPQVSLLIVGDGEETEALRGQIAALGLEQRITLTGRYSREQLAKCLPQCNAFVLASYAETFGIVFIEAMSAGLPAIGTICGGPEDIITPQSGYLIQPGDTRALAQRMKDMYEHYEDFDGKAIRQSVVDRFDFGLAGEKLKSIYQEALER